MLTPEEKSKINNSSTPTPEIDLVAYDVANNILILFEVKSYLDSMGVRFDDLRGVGRDKDRYILLNNSLYKKVVSKKLQKTFYQET